MPRQAIADRFALDPQRLQDDHAQRMSSRTAPAGSSPGPSGSRAEFQTERLDGRKAAPSATKIAPQRALARSTIMRSSSPSTRPVRSLRPPVLPTGSPAPRGTGCCFACAGWRCRRRQSAYWPAASMTGFQRAISLSSLAFSAAGVASASDDGACRVRRSGRRRCRPSAPPAAISTGAR
jgi:hypothetical protein